LFRLAAFGRRIKAAPNPNPHVLGLVAGARQRQVRVFAEDETALLAGGAIAQRPLLALLGRTVRTRACCVPSRTSNGRDPGRSWRT
jgi:hypothetical protein